MWRTSEISLKPEFKHYFLILGIGLSIGLPFSTLYVTGMLDFEIKKIENPEICDYGIFEDSSGNQRCKYFGEFLDENKGFKPSCIENKEHDMDCIILWKQYMHEVIHDCSARYGDFETWNSEEGYVARCHLNENLKIDYRDPQDAWSLEQFSKQDISNWKHGFDSTLGEVYYNDDFCDNYLDEYGELNLNEKNVRCNYENNIVRNNPSQQYFILPVEVFKKAIAEPNNDLLDHCLDIGYEGYDFEKELCYWIGFRTNDSGNKVMDYLIYATETESHPELALKEKQNCNENNGSWLDDACWVRALPEDDYCNLMVDHIGFGQLWYEMDNPKNEVCYGDQYLDELAAQIKNYGEWKP